MEFIRLGSLLTALWITCFLMITHYASRFVSRARWLNPRVIGSFASGVAVSYVFLHMLPELVEGNETIGKMLAQSETLTPLMDLGIFIIALFGFTIFFGLEQLAEKSKSQTALLNTYRLQLFMYCVYNFLITYTMPLRVQSGVLYALIFTVAIGIHFILTDRNFNRHFQQHFSHGGRLLLLGALFIGWLITAITDPINVLVVSLMIAFLSGSVLYNVFREEIPSGKQTSFLSFCAGIVIIAALLVALAVHAHTPPRPVSSLHQFTLY